MNNGFMNRANEHTHTHLQILYHRLHEGEQNVEPVFDVDVGGGLTQTNAGDGSTFCQALVATVVTGDGLLHLINERFLEHKGWNRGYQVLHIQWHQRWNAYWSWIEIGCMLYMFMSQSVPERKVYMPLGGTLFWRCTIGRVHVSFTYLHARCELP